MHTYQTFYITNIPGVPLLAEDGDEETLAEITGWCMLSLGVALINQATEATDEHAQRKAPTLPSSWF